MALGSMHAVAHVVCILKGLHHFHSCKTDEVLTKTMRKSINLDWYQIGSLPANSN